MSQGRTRRAALSIPFAALLLAAFLSGRASAAQPHWLAALDHLQAARRELLQAAVDQHGHRAEALRLVDLAMVQVKKVIALGRSD
jgi:hypothetical protein